MISRELRIKLVLFLGSALFALVIAEFGTRTYLELTREIQPDACRREDAILHHGYVPGQNCRYRTKEWDTEVKINSLGMRDDEVDYKKPENTFRILVLGDSFTAAESVFPKQTAMYLLETMLNENDLGFGKIEVVNAGVPSYSPLLEYLYLREYGFLLDPDLVILNFDLGDFSGENFLYHYYLAGEETLDPDFSFRNRGTADKIWGETLWQQKTNEGETTVPFVSVKVKSWLHQHSKFYELASSRLKDLFRKIRGVPPTPIYQLGEVENDFEYVTRSEENADDLKVYEKPLLSLKLTGEFLDKRNIPFLIIVFPHGHQVSGDEWGEGRVYYGLEKGKVYPGKSLDNLVKLGVDAGLDVKSVFQYFKNAGEFPLYYPYDGHFTPAGNRVMARAVFDILTSTYLKHDKD